MTIITKITAQKNNRHFFSVFIDSADGESFAFSVHEDVLVRFGLRKGLELDQRMIETIVHEDRVNRAYNLCLSYLAYRMRTEQEVIHYLTNKGTERAIIPLVIDKLKEHRYLDDRAFAKRYVHEKKRTAVAGPRLLREELIKKGIKEEDIHEALMDYRESEQIAAAKRFAIKKSAQLNKESSRSMKNKIGQQLLQKGFDYEIVQAALNEIPEKSEQEEWHAIVKQAEKAHRKYKTYKGLEYSKRMKQYLYRKGFSIAQIERVLMVLQDETE